MAIESLAKPVVDALLKALDRARDAKLRANARTALGEAISELIRISPDLNKAEAKIAIVRAAGILDQDLFTAERMLKKVKKAAKRAKAPKRKPASHRVKNASKPKSRGGARK